MELVIIIGFIFIFIPIYILFLIIKYGVKHGIIEADIELQRRRELFEIDVQRQREIEAEYVREYGGEDSPKSKRNPSLDNPRAPLSREERMRKKSK